ncbi:xanthine dehydrogenase family protein subunit M [Roseobacter sp. YSTF-M11]|uniref:Xanthine dehydrogenase family protein subunit M n=1 Tax=Roseobacter insulae TaxID=2859783 RepID=A0A9X1FXE8_9RHOB|nr:xanthine dehydrogenase family protein subunit M [Roseobacter insulae]MBW4709037.1 xanthine dehydrogenase family protein subunit M [Roseobacter insulae]
MKPSAFQYERPEDLQAALALLASGEDTRILAGGQSLVPMMNYRLAQPDVLVDINRLSELDYIKDDGDVIAIGALARHAAIKSSSLIQAHLPIIAEAYSWIAHAAVRNRGTLCGNLCHADAASEMPAIMQILEAEMVVSKVGSNRTVAARDFFVGVYETTIEADEILTEVRLPKPGAGTGWGFEEVAMRRGDYAWCTVVATLRLSDGRIAEPRIALAGVEDCATRLAAAETALKGQAPNASLFDDVAEAAAKATRPSASATSDAAYKRDLVRALLPRVLNDAVARST